MSPHEPMVALFKTQDLAVGEHGAIVADDPKIKLDVHDRRHSPAQATSYGGNWVMTR
jgi:hypothetical protein